MVCLAAFLLVLKARLGASLHSPQGIDTTEASAPWFFFFFFFARKMKRSISCRANKMPLFLKSWMPSFCDPSANFLPNSSPFTTFQSLGVFCSTCFSQRGEGPQAGQPLCLPGFLRNTVFFILLTSCCLFLVSAYVSCLVQLRSSNSCRGNAV